MDAGSLAPPLDRDASTSSSDGLERRPSDERVTRSRRNSRDNTNPYVRPEAEAAKEDAADTGVKRPASGRKLSVKAKPFWETKLEKGQASGASSITPTIKDLQLQFAPAAALATAPPAPSAPTEATTTTGPVAGGVGATVTKQQHKRTSSGSWKLGFGKKPPQPRSSSHA